MKNVVIRLALGMALPLMLAGASMAADKASDKGSDSSAMCAEMMKGSGPEGEKAMREFMQSDRAPQTMAKMMDMARRMGAGDPMLGMTRMMDMMGGGMMGGQGGMMSPPDGRPGK
jgi:hypothetical protein